ncbi:Serine proteinase stubble [Lucilia cuprina]|nr:Serine proteinase stubble [Lucilia cuprina]
MTVSLNKRSLKQRSPTTTASSTSRSTFAIQWGQLIVITLVIIAALINLTHGFKTINGESRKLFGGYRITPKHCRATKTLPSSDPRANGPTICMFNHECAQRNGEVVGACMDGFLFGACCQVPNNQQPENTLINDAQNSYYHQYQNQKLQQQESETNKIVSQAYETFAENSAQQQSLENSQSQDSGYGGVLSNLYNVDRVDPQPQDTSEQINTSSSTYGSTESVVSSSSVEYDAITQASTESQTNSPREPPKTNTNKPKDNVKVSPTAQSPQNDDFVLQLLNTPPPNEDENVMSFTTEIPTRINSVLNEQSSSESNSFEEEPAAATTKPLVKKPENQQHQTQTAQQSTVQQQSVQQQQHSESVQNQHSDSDIQQAESVLHSHHTEAVQHDHDQLFGGVTFTHSDITHPGADADLIEDDLQFSTGYGPQPVFVPAPPKPIQAYDQEADKHTSNLFDATTSSSSITTHVDSIETIIQQLNNNNNNNPGPTYNVINHDEQQQHHQSSSYGNGLVTATKRPVSYDEQDNTKHTSLPSLSYNEIEHNDKQTPANLYDQISSSTSLSTSSSAGESTTSNAGYADEFVLEDHTMPEINYNDYQASKHPTSDFNKMPAIGIAYPVDMSYMEEGGNFETDESSYTNNDNKHKQPVQQDTQTSYVDTKQQQQQQQNTQTSYLNTVQHNKPQKQQQQQQNAQNSYSHQQHQQQLNIQASYSSQNDADKLNEPQTVQNYVAETHQRPIATYAGVVTSQSYSPDPLPHEVVVSSYTTKVEENAEVSTEYKPIITTNQITTTSYKTTTKPVKHTVSSTSYTNRPTLVTKRPTNKKPTKASSQRPTTHSHATTNSIITQQHFSTTPLETKTPSPIEPLYSKPTASYNQGIQQDYIISSGSTPKPIVTRKPTKKQTSKPASTSYITAPTTPRPVVTPQFQYDQEVPVIQADDKLDSFVHSTAESLASATPTQETLSYDPPIFVSAGSQVHSQRPQYNTHKKPTFVKVQPTQRPTTVLITGKPSSLQTTATTFATGQHTTPLTGYGSTSFVYNSLVTRRPDFADSTAAGDYMGISTVNSNDFDDPGYYGSAAHPKPANQAYPVGTTEAVYPAPTDDKPAFPGYYGPTPTYPAFPVPGEKLDSPIEEEIFTAPSNDFINFPPVRNPNLNMSATSSAVTSDLELSTPAFVEDSVLKNKMNTLVHKIVESLQGNFEALADMIDDNNTLPVQTYQAVPVGSTVVTKKPTRKPVTRITTVKPKVTTKKPITRVSTKAPTKKPITTRKPEITTKRPVVRRTTTTTRRPATKKPTRKPSTTTKAPLEDEIVDEEDEEDVNPSDNEIVEEEGYGASASGRKIQCGMRPHVKSGRIVGGKGATFGAYPWQVLVRESTWLGLFTKNKCGGVLITSRYVITAAHCQPGFLASLVAVMGEFDISGDLESKRAVTKNVKRVIVHRQYDPATFENDIALLELESPVTFDTHIVPICMPSDVADFTGRMATVTGWGRLKYGGGVPSVLQEVQVPVIENSVCQEMFHTAGHNKKILNSFLCAGYANGQKDSCEGDSGGPLVLQRADGRYELAGTVSHGIKCAAPYLPGVYMRTTFYKPWLRSITGVK